MKPGLFTLFLILLFSCTEPEKHEKMPQEDRKVNITPFNQDSCYSFIQQQVDFGKRYMNTPEHENCKNWLQSKLKFYGFEVIPQTFEALAYNGVTLKGTNIIGRYNAHVKERILLCAHYDTRHIADKDSTLADQPIDGADDGGSGVAVLLEIARQIRNNPIPMGVDIIFFDAEDYGAEEPGQDYSWGLGSQYWSKNLHEKNYSVKYGILLDMVGSANATFPKEGYSMQSAEKEVNKIWRLAKSMGYGQHFVDRRVGFYTDDHRFVIENTNIPMLDVINIANEGRFGSYHHTHADNMEIIDKKTLQAVGQVIWAVVVKESNKDKF